MNRLIDEPILLLDEQRVQVNIRRMADKAERYSVRLKPHFKTHQSRIVGEWIRRYGVRAATVSSLPMARYFAEAGWDDITVAFPCNPAMARNIGSLSRQIDLAVLISEPHSAKGVLDALPPGCRVYIEIDTGSQRTGFAPSETDALDQTLALINGKSDLHLHGFYSHPGHSYACRTEKEVRAVHEEAVQIMQQLKERYGAEYPSLATCLGDTPCCSVGDNFDGIDEISPGNFIFYDLMQEQIGSCPAGQIAVALACPVVATYPRRNEIAVHGGAIHLSKDSLSDMNGTHYGRVVSLNDDHSWNEAEQYGYVKSLSQEHGIIRCNDAFFASVEAGDAIGILPVHSCLTADCMAAYHTTAGKRLDHFRGRG